MKSQYVFVSSMAIKNLLIFWGRGGDASMKFSYAFLNSMAIKTYS